MVHFSQHMIGAGWNLTEMDLDFIGELLPSGDIKMAEPTGANHGYKAGQYIPGLDLMTTRTGINKQIFIISMTFPQYHMIQTDYCGGGTTGKVTVKTRWEGNSWALYNCVLEIQSEGLQPMWAGYKDVIWTYKDLRAIA